MLDLEVYISYFFCLVNSEGKGHLDDESSCFNIRGFELFFQQGYNLVNDGVDEFLNVFPANQVALASYFPIVRERNARRELHNSLILVKIFGIRFRNIYV